MSETFHTVTVTVCATANKSDDTMQALKEVTLARFEDQEGDREYTAEELAVTPIECIRALFLA